VVQDARKGQQHETKQEGLDPIHLLPPYHYFSIVVSPWRSQTVMREQDARKLSKYTASAMKKLSTPFGRGESWAVPAARAKLRCYATKRLGSYALQPLPVPLHTVSLL